MFQQIQSDQDQQRDYYCCTETPLQSVSIIEEKTRRGVGSPYQRDRITGSAARDTEDKNLNIIPCGMDPAGDPEIAFQSDQKIEPYTEQNNIQTKQSTETKTIHFEHMMKNRLTEQFVDAIYKLPHQIFYKWALEVEKNKDIITEGIFETMCEAYETNPKIKVIPKEEILLRLRRDVIGQYLNMVYTAIMYSTKPNTIDYLNDYAYAQNKAFRIMHAMILEKSERIEDLIEESKKIKEISSGEIAEYLIDYILRHCIVFSKTISRQQIQRIESTLLNLGDKGYPKLLVSRWKKTGKIEH